MRSFLFLWATLVPSVVFGATVVPNTNITFGPNSGLPPANYASRVDQDPFGDFTGTWFEFKQISATEYSLRVSNYNLDEASDWYLVEAGDAFSKESIAANQFTPLFTTDHVYPAVTVGSDFYLGVNTGVGFHREPGGHSLPNRTAFGWIHFQVDLMPLPFPIFDDDVLVMAENVMSYNSPGIIVGTHTIVPEPAAIVTSGLALLALTALRRRKKPRRLPAAGRTFIQRKSQRSAARRAANASAPVAVSALQRRTSRLGSLRMRRESLPRMAGNVAAVLW